ncbi:MAG: EAL domain-containing protein [Treponemataceae bacterium]|nr:EAL domain-containing protein [Treponemataceae bacterium]
MNLTLPRIVDFDLCAIVIYIVVLVTMLFRRVSRVGADKYLFLIVLGLFLTTVFDFLAEMFGVLIPAKPELYWFRSFVCYAYFFLRNVHAPIYLLYIIKTSDIGHMVYSRKILVFIAILPLLIATITLFSNLFTNQVFVIDDQLKYQRGDSISILYFCNGLYMAMGISLLISCKKLFPWEKFIALVAMYPLNLMAVIIQLLYPRLLVEMLAAAVAVLFLMVTARSNEEMQDPILGVFNYRSFNLEMKKNLYIKKPISLLIINIFNWKSIYSVLGNENAIILLRRIKSRFIEILEKNKVQKNIFYLEQGFFALVDDHAPFENIHAAAEDIDEMILEDTVINQIMVELNSSICCISCPSDMDRYPDLLKFIENFRKYVTDTKGVAEVKDILSDKNFILKNELSEIIADAIINKTFRMTYQPIYSSEKNAFVSAEAFIRLENEKYGLIPTAQFIQEAERSGAIHQIWDLLIEDVCHFVSKNELKVIGFDHIDINISEVQFMEGDFAEKIEKCLRKYKVSPSMLAFELKETSMMNNQSAFLRNMKRLSNLGIQFALDDYGTGTSNISRIASLPVSLVKIDREFIAETSTDIDKGILKNTIALLKGAGMKTLAEGVETKETADLLIKLGCDYLQGYYYSKPLSKEDFMEKFRSLSADEFFL